MKKSIAVILAMLTVLTVTLTSCKKIEEPQDATMPYNYDLSRYVELPEYIGVKYTPMSIEVTEDDIDLEIKSVLEKNAEQVDVKGRGAVMGDHINMDYVGTMDGVAFSGGTAKGVDIVLGKASYISGFEDGLVGAKAGETVVLDLQFPDPYPNNTAYSGKPCVFTVVINSVKEDVIPELTDEFVEKHSQESKTVEEYREEIRSQLISSAEEEAHLKKCSDVWTTVVDNANVKALPENEVNAYIKSTFDKYESYAAKYNMTLDEYFEQNNSDYDTVYASVKSSVEESVAEELVIFAIAHKESITVTDKEYDEGALNYAKNMNYTDAAALEAAYGKQTILKSLMWDKVVEFVASKAVAEDASEETPATPVTPAETTPVA